MSTNGQDIRQHKLTRETCSPPRTTLNRCGKRTNIASSSGRTSYDFDGPFGFRAETLQVLRRETNPILGIKLGGPTRTPSTFSVQVDVFYEHETCGADAKLASKQSAPTRPRLGEVDSRYGRDRRESRPRMGKLIHCCPGSTLKSDSKRSTNVIGTKTLKRSALSG